MEVKEIVENLKNNKDGKFQKESILEARKQKAEVTEVLLKGLEDIANNIDKYVEDEEYFLPLYAMFLLAEFREKRAFPIIIKLITNNQETVDYLLGDLITGDLGNILASTFDGDIDSLYNIIVNLDLDECVREAVFYALEILNKYNIIASEKMLEMIDKMLSEELKEDSSIVITNIVEYISENQIYDKIELVRNLYNENRVDIHRIGDYDQFIDDIYGKIDYYSNKEMIEDTIESFSNWACFNEKDDEYNQSSSFSEKMNDLIKYEVESTDQEIAKIKELGRNDLCYCGSGKKYKKCCMNKKETSIVTPADLYIEKSLKNYPKEELKKFYDEECVEIDEKLYQVLKHKVIPLWVERNYTEEARRNTENMNKAIELIKEKCKKENINTVQEFDKKIAIHYTLNEIITKYFDVIDSNKNGQFKNLQNQKVEFLLEIAQIINLDTQAKVFYMKKILDEYLEDSYYVADAKKVINKFKEKFPDIKKNLNIELSKVYLEDGYKIEKALEPIEEYIKEFGTDEELDKAKIEIFYDYILDAYYEEDDEDEGQEFEICQKLWGAVKDFIKSYNITTENEYNRKQEEEYYFSNILDRIEQFYQENNIKYMKERGEFLKEALEIIELEEGPRKIIEAEPFSKEIIISGLADYYCDMNEEAKAFELVDTFIKEFPNSTNAVIIKANIYIYREKPEYENAIKILEQALNDNPKYCKHLLYSKIALLYDEFGNEEKANEYQELAMEYDEELPF